MRKSNWLIIALLVVASIFFLWLWYYLQFNLIDNPLDLVLTIIWWALVLLGCYGIHKAELKRQERVRTSYVAAGALFNSEAGLVEFEEGETALDTLQKTLADLEYNFDIQDFPDKEKVKFDYIVRSKKFELEKSDEEAKDAAEPAAEGTEAAEGEDATQVMATSAESQKKVKTWEGEVARVNAPDDDPIEFSSKEELARILAA